MKLYNGDCIEVMKKLIEEGVKVDAVICDVPYGTTDLKWDSVIPMDEMWECIHGLSKENTPVLLFGQEPFSSKLRLSNLSEWKYDWYWVKPSPSNPFLLTRRPGKNVEVISVFYKSQPTYNPIKYFCGKINKNIKKGGVRSQRSKSSNTVYGWCSVPNYKYISSHDDDGFRFPKQVIEMKRCQNNKVHPTQKPVELMEYLVKTYTNEGDIVLDFTMGSGTTGVACRNLNREFIGIELNEDYFHIAEDRMFSTAL